MVASNCITYGHFPALPSDAITYIHSICSLSNVQQVATPLVAKRTPIVCELMRKTGHLSLDLLPQL